MLVGIGMITDTFLQQVMQNFGEWLQQCFKYGGHLEQIILKN